MISLAGDRVSAGVAAIVVPVLIPGYKSLQAAPTDRNTRIVLTAALPVRLAMSPVSAGHRAA